MPPFPGVCIAERDPRLAENGQADRKAGDDMELLGKALVRWPNSIAVSALGAKGWIGAPSPNRWVDFRRRAADGTARQLGSCFVGDLAGSMGIDPLGWREVRSPTLRGQQRGRAGCGPPYSEATNSHSACAIAAQAYPAQTRQVASVTSSTGTRPDMVNSCAGHLNVGQFMKRPGPRRGRSCRARVHHRFVDDLRPGDAYRDGGRPVRQPRLRWERRAVVLITAHVSGWTDGVPGVRAKALCENVRRADCGEIPARVGSVMRGAAALAVLLRLATGCDRVHNDGGGGQRSYRLLPAVPANPQ